MPQSGGPALPPVLTMLDVRVTLTSPSRTTNACFRRRLWNCFCPDFCSLPTLMAAICVSDTWNRPGFHVWPASNSSDPRTNRRAPTARSNSLAHKYFGVECLFRPYWTLMKWPHWCTQTHTHTYILVRTFIDMIHSSGPHPDLSQGPILTFQPSLKPSTVL